MNLTFVYGEAAVDSDHLWRGPLLAALPMLFSGTHAMREDEKNIINYLKGWPSSFVSASLRRSEAPGRRSRPARPSIERKDLFQARKRLR